MKKSVLTLVTIKSRMLIRICNPNFMSSGFVIRLFAISILFTLFSTTFAQVAINENGAEPHASAMLDLTATYKGLLIPRMHTYNRTAIPSPAAGLMVYDTNTDSFWYYDGQWIELVTDGSMGIDGLSDGNSDGKSVFLGGNAGMNDDGDNYNVGIGRMTLQNNTSGSVNTGIGEEALWNNSTGSYNTGIGQGSLLYNATGSNNTAIGTLAGLGSSGTSFSGCVFLGYRAGYTNTSNNKLFIDNSSTSTPLIGGDFSTDQVDINGTIKITGGTPGANKVLTSDADGLASWETKTYGATELNELSDAITQVTNLFIGDQVGTNNNSGLNYNTAIGYKAFLTNISGTSNTALGYQAALQNSSGHNNVAIGLNSIYHNVTGSRNTAVGKSAGVGSSGNSYSGCVFLGYEAGKDNTSDNKLFITNSDDSTPLIGGDFSTDELYLNADVGIGTNSPNEQLEIAGASGANARMIVSDGEGSTRKVLLFVSPGTSHDHARIDAYDYGGNTGTTLKINVTGDGDVIFGGNVLPEGHADEDLGTTGNAWNDVYAVNYITEAAAAFANNNVTEQLISFPPMEKKAGAFDEFTDKGLKVLDPASLPKELTKGNALLIDEMTTYNYKANYEQQQQIETLKIENAKLKARLEKLEKLMEGLK